MSIQIEIGARSPVQIEVASVGPQGPRGEPGADGGGVPPGGVAGQVLVKSGSDDSVAVWADVPPPEEIDGGTF
jgi:hypothetical protein